MIVQNGQVVFAALLGLLACATGNRVTCGRPLPSPQSIYDFNATNIYGNETIKFDKYRGSVMAIVNVATYWGLTTPHYTGMNAFMTEFASMGFQVLAFPSNEFYMLEPGDTPQEILNGIKWVRPGGGYVPMFQMFQKINTNGKDEHAVYKFLKEECGPTSDEFEDGLFYSPIRVSDVRWNFEIFLVSKAGKVVYRYSPDHPISSVREDIRSMVQPTPIVSSNEIPVVPVKFVPEIEEIEEETNEI